MSILKVDELQSRTSGNRITLPDVNNYPPYRNLIINGDMSIAQRGTSQASAGSSSGSYQTIDRFIFLNGSLGAFTQSQDTDVPSGQGFATSMKFDCTTADASPAASDYLLLQQRIEGQFLQYLKKGTANAESLTLSFWVKSNKTGTYITECRDKDNNRDFTKSYTINSANTWEKKTLTFSGDTTGAFLNDNDTGLEVNFWLATGSDFSSGTLQSSWYSTNNANRVVGQTVNLADNTANEWYITGVQLEVGDSATPFEHLPYDVNYQRCQRYYQKTKTASGIGFGSGVGVNFIYKFPTPMRASPSASLDGVLTISDYAIANYTQSGANITINSGTNVTNEGISVSCVNFSGLTNYRPYALRQGFTNAINLDAEL